MASGKESPRQKMIGMMYLVLTALLALNVSREILKGFVTVDESIENSKLILTENNQRIKKAFEDYVNDGNFEAKPYLLKAIDAQANIRKVDAYIDSMKLLIVQKTEGMSKKDTSQLRFMDKLDDFDTPTHLLIGSDPANIKNIKYSAKDLRLQLTDLHTNLITLINSMQKNPKTKLETEDLNTLKQKLNSILPADKNRETNGMKLNWELENFYNMPMAAVITNLNKIQADMKNVESEILHVFSYASSKPDFKINKLQAKVMAPSAYVLAGQSFNADVVLGASSNELTEERMKVLIGAEYDTVAKKYTNAGTPIAIANGMGKYTGVENGIGEKNLKGVIEYKNTRGVVEYYPFDYKYMVAPAFTSVAADNMNIFYEGIDNDMTVSAAGFSPSQLKVTASGCGATLVANGPGHFKVIAQSTGTCLVTVMAQTSEGLKQQGPPKVFRVKGIPPPYLKIGGKLASQRLEFNKNDISKIGGMGAESLGFMFPVNYVVTSYEISFPGIMPIPVIGNNLTEAVKTELSKLKRGQIFYIDNIKVKTPKQTTILIAPATIKVI
jgi:gliding motility-associated protein GldM